MDLHNRASAQENLSSGVCKQQRRRPACASEQTDQHLCYSVAPLSRADPGIFVRGGPGQSGKKADNVFLVLSLFYRSQMVHFKENYHFSRFQSGSTFSRGNPTFSKRGQIMLIPYRNPYNL